MRERKRRSLVICYQLSVKSSQFTAMAEVKGDRLKDYETTDNSRRDYPTSNTERLTLKLTNRGQGQADLITDNS